MNDRDLFETLFEACRASDDPRGAVAAGLVRQGEMVCVRGSGDGGVRHAEDRLLEHVRTVRGGVDPDDILYVTLVPCRHRSVEGMRSCAELVVASGLRRVVYGADDPSQSEASLAYLSDHGVACRQVADPELVATSRELFNGSLDAERAQHTLPGRV